MSLCAAGWTTWAEGIAALAQAAAIVIGGMWAYFKFIRGRTFAQRAELSVTPTLFPEQSPKLKVRATLHNVGLSKLPLRTQAVFIYGIYAAPTADNPIATREQRIGKPKKIFAAHEWIEAQETVTDELLFLLPDSQIAGEHDWLAFRVECKVYAKRRKPGALSWSASALVPAEGGESGGPISSTAGASYS
jgi:hypothetical protein